MQPSQYLVSALLLMVAITRSVCCNVQQAALHASLVQALGRRRKTTQLETSST